MQWVKTEAGHQTQLHRNTAAKESWRRRRLGVLFTFSLCPCWQGLQSESDATRNFTTPQKAQVHHIKWHSATSTETPRGTPAAAAPFLDRLFPPLSLDSVLLALKPLAPPHLHSNKRLHQNTEQKWKGRREENNNKRGQSSSPKENALGLIFSLQTFSALYAQTSNLICLPPKKKLASIPSCWQ